MTFRPLYRTILIAIRGTFARNAQTGVQGIVFPIKYVTTVIDHKLDFFNDMLFM